MGTMTDSNKVSLEDSQALAVARRCFPKELRDMKGKDLDATRTLPFQSRERSSEMRIREFRFVEYQLLSEWSWNAEAVFKIQIPVRVLSVVP